ncbi:hypothetical protein P3W85_08980 [Cupriavidus basilensis]|uniref:Uncharacterized protein n=1 Tax=Cupriavidus basilensis TaxID=68895 RepID=A0ABT6AMT8_9BURK|nr:hypothetical protein [Cupriavidus basilensis]MDF3833081.1 hypothetical protein [Cupriavidus basilensis]
MTAPTNTDTLRHALQAPLPLQPGPLMGPAFAQAGEAGRFAIYTEPPEAPGRDEVLAALRVQLEAQPGGDEAVRGEVLDSDDWEPGQAFEMDMDSDDVCGQVLFYRLILARELDPVGYCAFEINADETGVVFVTLVESWIRAPYRQLGLERGFVLQMADAVYAVLAELDVRLHAAGQAGASFEVLLGLDEPSSAGSSLLQSLAETLQGLTGTPDRASAAGLDPLRITSANVSVLAAN